LTRYLVTSALPYANGPIHFGHVAGAYLPADVYVRTLRMQGEEVLFVCGADEFGVAITINAEQAGRPYSEYVAEWRARILETLTTLGIEFDVFSGTSSSSFHEATAQEFFERLDEGGFLEAIASDQLYCTQDSRFLADRYVMGTCYVCGKAGARGDECPSCGSWLDALRLGDPQCKVCGSTPEKRSTTHWYLDMPRIRDEFLGRWIEEHEWKPNVRAYITNMLKDVPKRPITRDMNWGVPVPEARARGEVGKVLYVWFDAPIGYVSFTKELFAERGDPEGWRAWWQSADTRLVHFIGKDNIPHHCMLFPAMLWGVRQDYCLPWQVPANEFYNLQGRKFSTSGGWYVHLEEYFERHDPEVTRFHILSSLPETADAEFTFEGLQRTSNAALVGTIGNLVTRVLRFVDKNHEGRVPPLAPEHEAELDRILLTECGPFADPGEHVRAFRFRQAAEQLVANAVLANVFVDRMAPWTLRKSDPELAASCLSTLCDWLAVLARWMTPFLPGKAEALWKMLGHESRVADQPWPQLPSAGAWRSLATTGSGQRLGEVSGLFQRLDDEAVAQEIARLERQAAELAPD
jgi:methionyl-tRNA synthetase